MKPISIINSLAPIRICDIGGWTDTWFAEYGSIFNIGVYPYAEVQIEVYPVDQVKERIVINAENFGERYVIEPEATTWDRHPLLEAAIHRMGVPDEYAFNVTIFSDAPSGASTGTSAAVSVSLIGALDRLTPGRLSQHEIAYAAHAVETEMLGLQCGIQDQLCSAFGGINYIDMHSYPYASVSHIFVPTSVWWELERRLVLVYLGKSHSSSNVHEKVIHELEDAGPENPKLVTLRNCATSARDALYNGDFTAFGEIMTRNTDAQAALHPELVGVDARKVIDIAREYGAIGWKVNGAGGDGGSVSILCGGLSHEKRAMIDAIEQANPLYRNMPIYLSRYGIRTWIHE